MMTAEGLQELHGELTVLEGDGRREIAERIKTAREWGDLKENSEYHDAKNEQAHLETQIARLRERIAAAVIVEERSSTAGGLVGFGSCLRVPGPGAPEARVAFASARTRSASTARSCSSPSSSPRSSARRATLPMNVA